MFFKKGVVVKMAKKLSVQAYRKALRKNIAQNCTSSPVRGVIRFPNNDVPNYLSRLEAFEATSKKAHVMVK